GAWERCSPASWHVSFSMTDLMQAGASVEARRHTSQTFRHLHDAGQASPLIEFVEGGCSPFEIGPELRTRIGGSHLRFRHGVGSDPSQVRKLQALKPPGGDVRLAVVLPELGSGPERRDLTDALRVNLFD